MEFVIIAILGILGAALIAGGIVMYRGSARVGVRAISAAAIASGVVMWALIVFVTPVSVERVEVSPGPTTVVGK